ncbi:MAG: HAD hydrolase family protein [Candidatus Cloacimonetes bacterium]|nr:HAD hydrolase family protein [Candidatus Cloacimonadota bacterium]
MSHKIMIFDNDGVFTDGGLYYIEEIESLRKFNAKDGLGIKLLQKTDIIPAIVTGKKSKALASRAQVLGIKKLYQNIKNKLHVIENMLNELDINFSEAIYMGDDLNDLPVLKKVSISICLPDSPDELKDICTYVTKKRGGQGAVREAIEYVLKQENKYNTAVNSFLQHLQNQ